MIYIILNIVCAVAVADKLGMKENEIKLGAKYLKPVEHRLQLRRNLNGSLIIDDAYNSNVKGSRMALDVLSNFKTRKKIFITPGIVDLGEKSDEYNKDLGKYAANKCDIAILVGEKQAKPIKEGLLEEGMNADKIFVIDLYVFILEFSDDTLNMNIDEENEKFLIQLNF